MTQHIRIDEYTYRSLMVRIPTHLATNNIAVLTKYVTVNNDHRIQTMTKGQREARETVGNEVGEGLHSLYYSYIGLDGHYLYGEESDAPIQETRYFVFCPNWRKLDTFTKDMMNFAKKFEYESIVIWSCNERKARVYETSDLINYKLAHTLDKFNIDEAQDMARAQLVKYWFTFTKNNPAKGNIDYVATDIREDFSRGIDPNGAKDFYIMAYREKLFHEDYRG